MKKALAVIVLCASLCSAAACAKESSDPKNFLSETIAESYELFSFKPERGATYKAYSADGTELSVLNGSFALGASGEYYYTKTIGGKTSYHKVIAKDTVAPEIRLSYTKKYVAPQTLAALPKAEIIESDGTNDGSVAVTFKNEEIAVLNDSFTPEKEGEYTVTFSATDKSGNAAVKTAQIICLQNTNKLNVIYEFSTAWGLENQTVQRKGIRAELSNELAPNGEKTCKFNITNADYYGWTAARKHELYLMRPLKSNWQNEFSSVYFWADNRTDEVYDVRFNGITVEIPPKSGWVKIEFKNFTLLGGTGSYYETVIDPNDYEGSYLCFQSRSDEFRYGEIFVSDIYGAPKSASAQAREENR